MSRQPCKRCGAMILEATADANDGLCAPCAKGGGVCEVCGTRMSQPNKSGGYVCWDCEKSRRIDAVPSLPKGWQQEIDVDWELVTDNYALAVDSVLQRFLPAQGDDPACSAVFQLSQNAMLELHLNTRDGIAGIPAKMRSIANWGQELSDEGWVERVGLWYTPAWKYSELGLAFATDTSRAIEDFHYDLYEKLSEDGATEGFNTARLAAIERVRQSDAFARIVKTPDFTVHVADDDGLEYYSKAQLGG
ncbi:hypothetical protein OJ996_23465 [Luteolibacter sp. GHJ8]|uniref:Uncharacterized protein n=1 Tax=Luteolibacter rhizosphaerae TaxID=2989719 RepID=A0ABT3G9P9_9BACT|nr:hypothetical protein [Luteolibacter rhizosphaerae]MCW1916566.1 hypothetical protein [Luteolibacter rhizosphaerae]